MKDVVAKSHEDTAKARRRMVKHRLERVGYLLEEAVYLARMDNPNAVIFIEGEGGIYLIPDGNVSDPERQRTAILYEQVSKGNVQVGGW